MDWGFRLRGVVEVRSSLVHGWVGRAAAINIIPHLCMLIGTRDQCWRRQEASRCRDLHLQWDGSMVRTKKLTGRKRESEAKVDKIREATAKLVNFGYVIGSDILLKDPSQLHMQ